MPAALAPQPNEISMQINRVKRKLIDCAHFVPEDVASGDLSDSADFRISKLRIEHRLRFAPSQHQQNKDFRLNWPLKNRRGQNRLGAVGCCSGLCE